MSAWMCSDSHFDALLTYALAHGGVEFSNPKTNHTTITADNVDAIGQILVDENVRSLVSRYGEDMMENGHRYTFEPFPHLLNDGEAYKTAACADYQSCESDDYNTTPAQAILMALVAVTEKRVGRNPAGTENQNPTHDYAEAPWGIDDDTFSAEGIARREEQARRYG